MSHIDNVINQGFKNAHQIHKKFWILKTEQEFLILDFNFGYLSWIPSPIFSPFLHNLKWESGNSPWIEILKNRESKDSVVENFYFFILSITH